jgi:spermidine/putrescine transport system ATP-binding protein
MTSLIMPSLNVDNLVKYYEGKPLIKGLSFSLQPEEVLCLLGPSGSGKSTLLRIIAGLESFEGGQVTWYGKDLVNIPPERRSFGFMFQDYALFPHLTVFENVAFGLRMQHLPKKVIASRVIDELERVNMAGFAGRKVQNLSGGEQQRIALARTLAPGPRLIMLDEPLGALDRKLREQLTMEIRQILKSTRVPAIYVTHDQEEAFTLADRVLLLMEGQIAQIGTPEELYHAPSSSSVAKFIGLGTVTQARVLSTSPLIVHSVLGSIQLDTTKCRPRTGEQVNLLIRPDGVTQVKGSQKGITGLVKDSVFQGHFYHTEVLIDQVEFIFDLPTHNLPGVRIRILPKADTIILLDVCDQ